VNIQQLKYFVAAAEHGSLLRAAEDLRISQSGLSRSISALEATLGRPLLERQARGVALTAAGHRFLRRAHVILHEHARARDDIRAEKELKDGAVTIGLNNFLAYFLTDEVLIELLGRPGRISLVTHFDGYLALRERTLAAEFDLAVSIYEPARQHPELIYEDLMPFESVAASNRSNPLARSARVTPADLARCRWALIEGQAIRQLFDDYFRNNEVDAPLLALRSASIPFLISAVARLDLVTILPRPILSAKLAGASELRALKTEAPMGRARLGLIHRRNGVQTPLAQELARQLKRHAKSLVQQ
jgi:DNA-binding transcriptional LysR family regulator